MTSRLDAIRARADAAARIPVPILDDEWSCPNCQTPWKCNGPHVPDPDYDPSIESLMVHAMTDVPLLLAVAEAAASVAAHDRRFLAVDGLDYPPDSGEARIRALDAALAPLLAEEGR